MSLTAIQYQSIMRGYDERRSEAFRLQTERLNEIRSLIPEYSKLEDESAHIAIEYAMRSLDDPNLSLQDMDEQLEALTVCRNSLLRAKGYDPSYVKPVFTCPDCEDTGYIDGQKCHCFLQQETELLYNQSNIREFLKTENFSHLRMDLHEGDDLEHFKAAVDTCHAFVDNFDKDYTNLMLCGTVGTGKSFLSGCIAQQLLENGKSVIYFSATDLFEAMSDNAFHRSTSGDSIPNSDLYDCDLLVIDDLGTELTNQFVCSSLFTCLNERHIRRKPTIVSTNLKLSELHERYSDRVFSRAVGNFTILKLTGPDLRIK